jgi:hypothetical protein
MGSDRSDSGSCSLGFELRSVRAFSTMILLEWVALNLWMTFVPGRMQP